VCATIQLGRYTREDQLFVIEGNDVCEEVYRTLLKEMTGVITQTTRILTVDTSQSFQSNREYKVRLS